MPVDVAHPGRNISDIDLDDAQVGAMPCGLQMHAPVEVKA
jgi:hypothetical protein